MPITAFYVLVIALVLWVVTEYLPIGRYLYAIGANPRAAALNGIPVRRYVIGAFVASGAARRRRRRACSPPSCASARRASASSILLPALVGAFLGSTTIKPGRVNVWGTIVGVAILAVGISGIQQLGGAFYVEPLFNGVTLLIAIGIAGYAQRKRGESAMRAASRSTAGSPADRSRRHEPLHGRCPQGEPKNNGRRSDDENGKLLAAAGGRRVGPGARRPGGHADAVSDAKAYRGRRPASRTRHGTARPPARRPQPGKTIVYVSTDQRNGGARGVGEGVRKRPRRSAGRSG